MFLTTLQIFVLTSCIMFRKKLEFRKAPKNISKFEENYRRYNFQAYN